MTKIETSNIKYSTFAKNFVKFLCAELEVKPNKIFVFPYEVEDQNYGLCIDDDNDEFTILVRDQDRKIEEIFTTIAHEMVHVKQYMKENLGWCLDNSHDVPYYNRWWEKEAFEKAIPLVEKYAKGLKV